MQARLKVLHDKANVKQVKLLPVTLIGRSTDCNLKIASSQVSRNHCRITLGEDTVFVEDLGSANGTLVDGQPLPAHQPMAIAPGAHLIVGPAEFQIDYIAPTSATMVLTRSSSAPAADLPSTEMMVPGPTATIPAAVPVAAPIAVAAPVAVAAPPVAVAVAAVAASAIPAPMVVAASPVAAVAAPRPEAPPSEVPTPVTDAAEADSPTVDSPNLDAADTVADFNFAGVPIVPGSDEMTVMMSFDEQSPAVAHSEPTEPAEPAAKKGGLKSLFSLFGRKERTASANPAEAPAPGSTGPSVFLPAVDSPEQAAADEQPASKEANSDEALAVEIGEEEVGSTTETTELSGPAAPGTSTDVDDGFQQFLKQF